jgi:hypothetical protein
LSGMGCFAQLKSALPFYSICQNNVPVTSKRGCHTYDNPYSGCPLNRLLIFAVITYKGSLYLSMTLNRFR